MSTAKQLIRYFTSPAAGRGLEGFRFFGYALSHYYGHGTHVPGQFDIWDDFRRNAPPRSICAPASASIPTALSWTSPCATTIL